MTITKAMKDPNLFRKWFEGTSWAAWEVLLKAAFGLRMTTKEKALFERHTGRKIPPESPASEAWIVSGRRSGKSRIAALLAVFLACFKDWSPYLGPGEIGVVMVLASDRKQARVVFNYIRALIAETPLLHQMVANEMKEALELTNRITIEIHTASHRAIRGYSVVAAIVDEIAFLLGDEASLSDTELITALRPAMATIPGSMLVSISSPYARRGALWEAYRRHYGQEGDPSLVWQAGSADMNPLIPPEVISRAYEEDESSASAEYGGQFRRDVETFVSREAVEAVVIPERLELPAVMGIQYRAFVDPSGGAQDSMTLGISHLDRESGRVILDLIRERKPPFDPDAVVKDFAADLLRYGLANCQGDRYAGEWVSAKFKEHGVSYSSSAKPKSDIYRDLLPLINSNEVELLDHPRLLRQLLALERRTARGGRDSIDHPPRQHDDVVNAAAGAVIAAKERIFEIVAPVEVNLRPSPFRIESYV